MDIEIDFCSVLSWNNGKLSFSNCRSFALAEFASVCAFHSYPASSSDSADNEYIATQLRCRLLLFFLNTDWMTFEM
jgi:hypothetical protein